VNPLRLLLSSSILRYLLRVSFSHDKKIINNFSVQKTKSKPMENLAPSGEKDGENDGLSPSYHAALLLNTEGQSLPKSVCAPPPVEVVPLFDPPRILDISSLFGATYPEVIKDLLHRLFTCSTASSSFPDELRTALIATVTALSKLSHEVQVGLKKAITPLSSDSVQYVNDIFRSWAALVNVSPDALRLCLDEQLLLHVGIYLLSSPSFGLPC